MVKIKSVLFILVLLLAQLGVAMKPYRPELMVFTSPDKKMQLHSPYGENTTLVKKGSLKKEKIHWKNRMSVTLVFSDPTRQRVFTIGGLGDSGMSLGVIDFYTFSGELRTVNLKDSMPDLESLSRGFGEKTNFPWISAINITDKELQIWICDKKLATVAFADLKVAVSDAATAPDWAKDLKNERVSASAKKHQWILEKEKQ